MGDNSQQNDRVTWAALIVSSLAFIIGILQLTLQLIAYIRGYYECNEKTIGKWSKSVKLSFRKLRPEVLYEAPVIFLCPPDNDKGPIRDKVIFKLDGTEQSFADTWTTWDLGRRSPGQGQNQTDTDKTPKSRIHTADNERASWWNLLSAIQIMENESRTWHEAEMSYNHSNHPPQATLHDYDLSKASSGLEERTLIVALQRNPKSWDHMPASISRPYATTTMCHLVETMAVLGIYWTQFDRRADRYLAEGNGFTVLGERVSDLGLMFNFQVNGIWEFGRSRVIPVDEIKELCFGWVPTIFRSTVDARRLKVPIDLVDLSSLQMGSRRGIAETLLMIGCNNNAVSCFRDEGKRTSHLFPVSFEILAMLSQVFHIENTYFTYIPNPTPDRWNSRSISLIKMMDAFWRELCAGEKQANINPVLADRMKEHIRTILKHTNNGNAATLARFKALHAALDDADEILTGRNKRAFEAMEGQPTPAEEEEQKRKSALDASPPPAVVKSPTNRFMMQLGRTFSIKQNLHQTPTTSSSVPSSGQKAKALPTLGEETKVQQKRREMAQDVLSSHIQEVLSMLNDGPVQDDSTNPNHNNNNNHHRNTAHSALTANAPSPTFGRPPSITRPPASTIEQLDAAGPEDRQDVLMQIYWQRVRAKVARDASRRRRGNSNNSSISISTNGNGTQQHQIPTIAVPEPIPNPHPSRLSDQMRNSAQHLSFTSTASTLNDENGNGRPVSTAGTLVSESESTAATCAEQPDSAGEQDIADAMKGEKRDGGGGANGDATDGSKTTTSGKPPQPPSLAEEPVGHEDIWCALVFRMVCWLMLHDFNAVDFQAVPKSELLGSRMPVYVA